MNATMFISILLGGSLVTVLLTQAIKQFYYNKGQSAPPNLIAAINAIVVGGLLTAVVYIWLDIPWTTKNILALCVMTFFVWIGSMIGYKQIFESIKQYKEWKEQLEKGEIPSISEDTSKKE